MSSGVAWFLLGLVLGAGIGLFTSSLLWAAKRGDDHIHQ